MNAVWNEKKYMSLFISFYYLWSTFRRSLLQTWKDHVILFCNFDTLYNFLDTDFSRGAYHFCLVIFGRSCFSRSKYWYIKNTHQICFLCHFEETLVVLLLMIILLPRRFRVLEMMTVQAFFLLDHWPRIIFANSKRELIDFILWFKLMKKCDDKFDDFFPTFLNGVILHHKT